MRSKLRKCSLYFCDGIRSETNKKVPFCVLRVCTSKSKGFRIMSTCDTGPLPCPRFNFNPLHPYKGSTSSWLGGSRNYAIINLRGLHLTQARVLGAPSKRPDGPSAPFAVWSPVESSCSGRGWSIRRVNSGRTPVAVRARVSGNCQLR